MGDYLTLLGTIAVDTTGVGAGAAFLDVGVVRPIGLDGIYSFGELLPVYNASVQIGTDQCGNSVVQPSLGEECDYGVNNAALSCSDACQIPRHWRESWQGRGSCRSA